MKTITIKAATRLGLILAALALATTACLDTGSSGGTRTTRGPQQPAELLTLCSNAAAPEGYFKVNDRWDPTSCGDPTSLLVKNISIYQRYDNKEIGSRMSICINQQGRPLPAEWSQIDTGFNGSSCGSPRPGLSDNVQTVQRIR